MPQTYTNIQTHTRHLLLLFVSGVKNTVEEKWTQTRYFTALVNTGSLTNLKLKLRLFIYRDARVEYRTSLQRS